VSIGTLKVDQNDSVARHMTVSDVAPSTRAYSKMYDLALKSSLATAILV
jgi:hypothetical protein